MHRAKTPQSPYLFPACLSPRSTGFRQPRCEKKKEPEEGSGRRWWRGRHGGAGRFRRGGSPQGEAAGGVRAEPRVASSGRGRRRAKAWRSGGARGGAVHHRWRRRRDCRRPPPGRSRAEGVQSRPGSGSGSAGRNPPAAEKMGAEACADPPGGAGEGRPADEDTRVCSPTDLLLLDDLLRRQIRSICRQTLEDGAAPGRDHGRPPRGRATRPSTGRAGGVPWGTTCGA